MPFLDTEPAPIQRLSAGGRWSRFRITDPRQRESTLRELCRGDVPLTLGRASGPTVPAQLWACDGVRQTLFFSLGPEATAGQMQALLVCDDLWAAGYLHEAKVQFELRGLLPGDGADATPRPLGGAAQQQRMLRAGLPEQMLHLPRRRALRVRQDASHAPVASLRHPLDGRLLRLAVADVSMTGCALWKSVGMPALHAGQTLEKVTIALDERTGFQADVLVRHITVGSTTHPSSRIGCDWQDLPASAADVLKDWIGFGRRRRDLLSLSFD